MEYWWITDPKGHRQVERLEAPGPEEKVDTPFGPMDVFVSIPPDDDWACDFCNEDIPLSAEGHPHLWVPVLGSNALCPRCYEKNGGVEKWMSNPQACGCAACTAWVERQMKASMQ